MSETGILSKRCRIPDLGEMLEKMSWGWMHRVKLCASFFLVGCLGYVAALEFSMGNCDVHLSTQISTQISTHKEGNADAVIGRGGDIYRKKQVRKTVKKCEEMFILHIAFCNMQCYNLDTQSG